MAVVALNAMLYSRGRKAHEYDIGNGVWLGLEEGSSEYGYCVRICEKLGGIVLAVMVAEAEGETVRRMLALADGDGRTDMLGDTVTEVLTDAVMDGVVLRVTVVDADPLGVVLGVSEAEEELDIDGDDVGVVDDVMDIETDGVIEADIDGVALIEGDADDDIVIDGVVLIDAEADMDIVIDGDGDGDIDNVIDSRGLLVRSGRRNGAGDVDGDRDGRGGLS